VNTRIKIAAYVGLALVAATGVVLLCPNHEELAVRVSFSRWHTNGSAILSVTNRGSSALYCSSLDAILIPYPEVSLREDFKPMPVLLPRSDARLLVWPVPVWGNRQQPLIGKTISVQCLPKHSKLRQQLEVLLSQAGINIASTGFVVTVNLPARVPPQEPTP